MIYIGIDTGTNTGIAVYDNHARHLVLVDCMPIHRAMRTVETWYQKSKDEGVRLIVRVEDPRQRTWYEKMTREQERMKLQGVGSVKRDASIWEDYLKDLFADAGGSGEFEMVAPKHNVTKLSQDRFKVITGWSKRTNEHGRDAAMLVFGF
nr:MAG TPA: HOLLIDAY JUNCTION RESOLVASE [Caudoviricetes sp.]